MMTCLCHVDAKQTMRMWCSCNVNTNGIMQPYSSWHEWNANSNDVMMTGFASFVNLGMSCLAYAMHTDMHGACALHRYGTSKYQSGLACTQADLNLEKITASHVWVLTAPNARKNMPNMIPIAYLNKNFMDCNENLAWSKQEPLIHPYMFWYTTKGEKVAKTSFYFFHVVTITFKPFQIIFSIEYQHTSTVEHC